MRGSVVLLLAAAVLLLPAVAAADVLKLSNGGQLKGTVTEVTFLIAGREKAYPGADIRSFWLSEVAQDILGLKNGAELKGEFIWLKFNTLGGVVSFNLSNTRCPYRGLTFESVTITYRSIWSLTLAVNPTRSMTSSPMIIS